MMNNYRMGGVAAWNEMTDISFFLIDNDIDKYSENYMPNAFHRAYRGRGIIFIALRFLQGGGDYYIDKNGVMTEQFVTTERVLAHEIGHNIFWSWHFDTQMGVAYEEGWWIFKNKGAYSVSDIPFNSDFLEATANVFMSQIGYDPIKRWSSEKSEYNFQDYNDYLLKTLRR